MISKRKTKNQAILFKGIFLFLIGIYPALAGPIDPGNGNPFIPGYFADPFVFYDVTTDSMFYIYSTSDGYDRGNWTNWGPFGVWYSKDFINWSFKTFDYPANFPYLNLKLWAPSVTKARNGRYYMYYNLYNGTEKNGDSCHVVSSGSPLGPWKNERNGTRIYSTHVFDADVFKDNDSSYYLISQQKVLSPTAFYLRLMKLVSTMDTIVDTPIILFSAGTVGTEGATIFKRNGIYYLTFSQGSPSSDYHVRYGYSRTGITGPYSFPANNTILQGNTAVNILAPGHSSVLQLDTNYYIVYHRFRYPTVNTWMFRQTCADKISFNTDGTIKAITPTHTGIGAIAAKNIADSNCARGKSVTASSYQDTTSGPKRITDENFGTLWKAANTSYPQTLTIDLGSKTAISRVETCFEYPTEYYRYTIHTSPDNSTWTLYADRSTNTHLISPMIDSNSVTMRYVRITISGISHSEYFPAGDELGLVAGIWEVKICKQRTVDMHNHEQNRLEKAAGGLGVNRRLGKKYLLTFDHIEASRSIAIQTISGKTVSTFPAPGKRVVWNGRDNAGGFVARGIYVMRIDANKLYFYCKVLVY